MSKKRESIERSKDQSQMEGERLARARRAAQLLGVALPTQIPSKYTRRGKAVHRQVLQLSQTGEALLTKREEEQRRREAARQEEHRQRLEALQRVPRRPEGPIPDALGLEAPDRMPEPDRLAAAPIPLSRPTAPPRRSTLPRGLMALLALSLSAGLDLPRGSGER